MKLRKLILSLAIVGNVAANALTLQQAKTLYNNGQFSKALSTFAELAKKNPGNANYSQWYGACLYETGQSKEAKKYIEVAYSKNVTDAVRYMAEYALDEMDYAKMAELIDNYTSRISGKESTLSATAAKSYAKLKHINEMFNSVEKIQIFDSINVNKSEFMKFYKLSKETGTINTSEVLPTDLKIATPEVFITQSGNRMIWSMPDSTGCIRLAESYRLADGNWDHASLLPENLNNGGNAAYPFVMTDGTTIYYANNGENSLGGYDIFMSRKDFTSGEYLNPQNIGFPYNSPYDDYMYVMDEMTGIGWWATDRNQLGDKVTIYMFKSNDVRQNYNSDEDDVYSLAAVRSIKDSWEEDADYSSLKETIADLAAESETQENEFAAFQIKNGVSYTRYDNFKSSEAESLMHKRESLALQLADNKKNLKELRYKYAKASTSVRSQLETSILKLEKTVEKNVADLAQTDNQIRSAERSALGK